MVRLIVFTDLDGTLIDRNCSFHKAGEALNRLKGSGAPLVICSSKTRAEIEYYRERLSNAHPFISENGGAIFVPEGYFSPPSLDGLGAVETGGGYRVVRLGAPYSALRTAMEELRGEGFAVRGFGDMTVEEVASLTGLSPFEAELAKRREFDEPFLYQGAGTGMGDLLAAIEAKGYTHTEGRVHHLLGPSDKGKAVSILARLYRREQGPLVSCALGDSPNDIPMLAVADIRVVVQGPDGRYDPRIDLPDLVKAQGVGPEGWNEAVLRILDDLSR